MKRQIVVIGLGRFGISLATTLIAEGHDVLAVDKDENRVMPSRQTQPTNLFSKSSVSTTSI